MPDFQKEMENKVVKIHFTKMHGCGNDYIYVNCLAGELPAPGKLSAAMSPRHFSVGADGLVMICASDTADAKMRMFNLDGSEGKMCGNAIRCVGKYLYDNGIVTKKEITIETLSGLKYLTLDVQEGRVRNVTVDMGKADFRAAKIPVVADGESVISQPVTVAGEKYYVTCVSMGNPHAVIFLPPPDKLPLLPLEKIGPIFENHPIFPERVNTEFVRVIDRQTLQMRVWERGSGETYACGTGACATVAAAVKNGICEFGKPVTVRLVGGDLTITVEEDYRVFMAGSATKVYEGVYEYEE